MTSIENLSNELFHDIFDYLEACDIYMAFSNFNNRFQQLLNNSSLLFKIKQTSYSVSDAKSFQNWTQIAHINRQQILSIHLLMLSNFNQLFGLLYINSSFQRLESVVLLSPEPDTLMLILNELISLPCLFSLTIEPFHFLNDFTDIYRVVLTLSALKYYKISASYSPVSNLLPISTNQQLSTIEYLIMDHSSTFNQLSAIASYMPRLRHLSFFESFDLPATFGIPLPSTLTNLTYLRIRVSHVTFDQFEMFIRQIRPKLKVLIFITLYGKMTNFDAYRWEQLIVRDLPLLEQFSLRHFEGTEGGEDYEPEINFRGSNPFLSSFWLERQWIFDVKTEDDSIIYSVGPYRYSAKNFYKINSFISFRKRWYEQPNVDNSTMKLSKSARLSLSYVYTGECYELLIMDIENILNVTQIYHLEISKEETLFDILIQIINALPQLTTIKLHSISFNRARDSETNELIIFPSTTSTNRITKVYLENMFHIEEVYSMMELCPYMSYFKIDYLEDMMVHVFIRLILNKVKCESNQYLRLLCVPAPKTDDSIIRILETMKNDKKSLDSYTIKHVGDHIFLQWK
jgi:hypothetical protein